MPCLSLLPRGRGSPELWADLHLAGGGVWGELQGPQEHLHGSQLRGVVVLVPLIRAGVGGVFSSYTARPQSSPRVELGGEQGPCVPTAPAAVWTLACGELLVK